MTFLEWYLAVTALLMGAVIGSFLNVVIYRLHTGKSLAGRSHCLSCQATLVWYELIPILSYVGLVGHCRHCRAWIPARYLLVELLTAMTFLMLWLTVSNVVVMLLMAILLSTLIVGLVYDLYHLIIPDEIPLIATGVAFGIIAYEMVASAGVTSLLAALGPAVAASGFFALLWLVSRGRWIGLGDAKLTFPLALLLSLSQTFSFVVLAFWIGALTAVVVFAATYGIQIWNASLKRIEKSLSASNQLNKWLQEFCSSVVVAKYPRYLTMKMEIPFAPFLIISFVLVYFAGVDVLELTAYVISTFI